MYVYGGPDTLGTVLTGAFNSYYHKTYTGISPHNFVYFTATFWFFDQSWEGVAIKLDFDGIVINGPKIDSIKDMTMRSGGLANSNDLSLDHIYAGVVHSGDTLTLRIISQAPEGTPTGSFAFRDVHLTFSNYLETVTACHRSEEINTLTYDQCPCPVGKGLSSSGICDNCANGCDLCFGSATRTRGS